MMDLLDSGAKVDERDDQGETALHHAARWGRADEAKLLLDRGADPNAKDKTGRTALHCAVTSDAQRVFQVLLRNRQTNINEKAFDGATAMILAAKMATEGMVEELIQSKVRQCF